VKRHELTDSEWLRIKPLLGARSGPVSKRGDREFINAVVWKVKTGVQWRDLHERFGNWKTVYNRFNRWAHAGRWETIFNELRLQADPDEIGSLVDASVVRAHQDASGGKGGGDEMLWGVLEEVFQQRFTPSQRRMVSQSTEGVRNSVFGQGSRLSHSVRDATAWQ
jgi:putative transposase